MTDTADRRTVNAWIDDWGTCVAAVDFEAAKPLFAADVVGFGTHKAFVEGLAALAAEQWGTVWPTIRDFRFQTEDLICMVSPDRLQACAIVPWSSTGFHKDGRDFDRPGRATIVLTRTDPDAPWQGRHTHFSLRPGVPERSYALQH
ncbi:MAG: nuclear transport factor 2 family protein [Alphaproteobacteria bacterium]